MKKRLFLIILSFLLFPSNNIWANIGPVFDVKRLYNEVPIVCKVTIVSSADSISIEDPRAPKNNFLRPKQMLKTKLATM